MKTVALIFPDSRAAALGAPGFREVYREMLSLPDMRVMWGWYDADAERVRFNESPGKAAFDCVAFSIPYELQYFTVVRALKAMGIEPLAAKRRGTSQPRVVLGGAAPTINPLPASVMADIIFTGEAEGGIGALFSEPGKETEGAACQLTPMIGAHAPMTLIAAPQSIPAAEIIDSSILQGFDSPSESVFADAGLVEVGRGCGGACRFCAAGHIGLPARFRSVGSVLDDVLTYQDRARRIGLVGASVSDHPRLEDIVDGVVDRGFGVTTSSFRADRVTPRLAGALVRGGLKTLTIAPEGGSERVRAIINKRLKRETILEAADICAATGFAVLRLYYMIGLPWEREDDRAAIVDLTREIAEIVQPRGIRLTVSVNPFIPKPRTPFQWCGLVEKRRVVQVFDYLKKEFRLLKGIELKTMSYRVAEREAVISRGDRRVGEAIAASVGEGIPWNRALKNAGVDVQEVVRGEPDVHSELPWDGVCGRASKTALRASFEKAARAAEN